MRVNRGMRGELTTHLVCHSGGNAPKQLCVMCHGYGAPGDDLVDLSDWLWSEFPELSTVAFAFPEAPLEVEGWEGRAWWPLNMTELQRAVGARDFRELQVQTPAGLLHASQLLSKCLQHLSSEIGVPHRSIILGGFSQGAMISAEVAWELSHAGIELAGLVQLSGTLIRKPEWSQRIKSATKFPVFQSHGRQDVVLPFFNAEPLYEMLVAEQWPVEFVPFAGGHGIPPQVLTRLGQWLAARQTNP